MLVRDRMFPAAPPNPLHPLEATRGQKLLSLVRSLENEEDEEEHSRILEAVCTMLKKSIRIISMKGLLQGDIERAELILASNSSGDGNAHQDNNSLKKKRGRRKSDQKLQSMGESSAAASTDESLIFSAVIRVFGWNRDKSQSTMLLVKLCADLCTAMSEHLKSTSIQPMTKLGLAEYQLMSSPGIPVLKALLRASTHLLSSTKSFGEDATQLQPDVLLDVDLKGFEKEIMVLQSCLKSAASLVELFGTKLSRSSGLVSDFQKLGLSALTIPCCRTQTTAAKLLAALPLTGVLYEKGAASKSVGEQWSRFFMDSATCLSEVLRVMAPVSPTSESSSDGWQLSKVFEVFLEQAKSCFRERLPKEELRASAFRFLVHGLYQLTSSIAARDYRCPSNDSISLDVRISVVETLSLLDYMLSFSFASERLYFATKKRLRSEIFDGGVLSPTLFVTEVASFVKYLGHRLFDTVVSAVGYPSLLPHANRILRMASKALLTSTPAAVQKAVDPSSVSFQTEGQINEWLNTSISQRIQAVQTFGVAISLLGLSPSRNNGADASSWFSAQNETGAEKCVSAVGGCLLEQLVWFDGADASDWGTSDERVELAERAVQSLESTILSCGGFMPLTVRVLIDSIANASLDSIVSSKAPPIAAFSKIKVAIFRLGSACVSAPWPSGASSSLRDKLFDTALRCRTHDAKTSVCAMGVLRVCESLGTPRVPALHVDRQIHDFSGSSKPASADSLMRGIQKAVDEQHEQQKVFSEEVPAQAGDQPSKRRKDTHTSVLLEPPQNTSQPTKHQGALPLQEKAANTKQTPIDKEPTAAQESPFKGQAEPNRLTPTKPESEAEDEGDFFPEIVDGGGPDEDDA